MSQFRFDPISFVIGFLGGTIVAFVIYRLRSWIAGIRREAGQRAESARRYATRTADARYQIDIRDYCQRYHVAGQTVRLSDIVIEPRFIPGVEVYDTTGERKMRDVFHVVPRIHKFPASYAPYNIKTLSIEDLGASEHRLALLGLPGSGRSTALATIALWAMGVVEFEKPEDIVQLAIDEEDSQFDDKQRAARRKERAEIRARALEQIAHAQEEASVALGEDGEAIEILNLHRLMPILVHLADLVIDPETQDRLDPAEPLVQAIQRNLRRVTAITVPRYVYNRLNSGQALVLIDGLDDLPAEEQPSKLAWLSRFLESYPLCVVIVTGPTTGYHALQQIGLTPMFLRPWTDLDVQHFTAQWAEVWPAITRVKRRLGAAPDERTVRVVAAGARGLTPLDLTARVVASYTRNEEEVETLTRWDWYTGLITRKFHLKEFENNDELMDDALYATAQVAARTLDAGPLSAEELRSILAGAMRRVTGEGEKAKETFALDIDRFFQMLTVDSGLMISRAADRYDFAHPLQAAFLASAILLDPESGRTLEGVVTLPAWQPAIAFAAAEATPEMMNRAVVARLSQQPDLLFASLFEIANWMPDAPADAAWRAEMYRRFASALIAPTQFPALREQAMAALVATRDRSTVFILRQALRSTDPHVRQLGCVGLGALGDGEAIRDLRPMLEDDVLDVQLAAGLALGAIGTEKAIEVMVDGLLTGEESLRQAVAEALAFIPGEGHQMLHTAATSEDMMVRRAAVFGLARIGTSWALIDLYRRLLEDDQWYVRSAAEQAFAKAQSGVQEAVRAHPSVETLDWVTDWVGEQGANAPAVADEPRNILLYMLTHGEQPYRIASARTLAHLGYLPALDSLYQSLADPSEDVRTASYAALADFQAQIGQPLPGIL